MQGEGNPQVVLGRDDQAPAGPDEARCRQGGVLGQRQLLCWTEEVGYTGKDDGPLCRSCVQLSARWIGCNQYLFIHSDVEKPEVICIPS